MRFWDSSALVPLLCHEPTSAVMDALYRNDSDVIVWWATEVECVSALTRRAREQALSGRGLAAALRRLSLLAQGWHHVLPTERLRDMAKRLLRVHPLRGADALQLAAAIGAAEHDPASLEFVCLDDRLASAAEKEGFPLLTSRSARADNP